MNIKTSLSLKKSQDRSFVLETAMKTKYTFLIFNHNIITTNGTRPVQEETEGSNRASDEPGNRRTSKYQVFTSKEDQYENSSSNWKRFCPI